MGDLVKFVQDEFVTKKEVPDFSAGDPLLCIMKLKKVKKNEHSFLKVW